MNVHLIDHKQTMISSFIKRYVDDICSGSTSLRRNRKIDTRSKFKRIKSVFFFASSKFLASIVRLKYIQRTDYVEINFSSYAKLHIMRKTKWILCEHCTWYLKFIAWFNITQNRASVQVIVYDNTHIHTQRWKLIK